MRSWISNPFEGLHNLLASLGESLASLEFINEKYIEHMLPQETAEARASGGLILSCHRNWPIPPSHMRHQETLQIRTLSALSLLIFADRFSFRCKPYRFSSLSVKLARSIAIQEGHLYQIFSFFSIPETDMFESCKPRT